jgi:chromate reductase
MAMARDVAILVGSLRKESFTRKVANTIASMGGAKLAFRFVEIGTLPLYNQDLDPDAVPNEWVKFRNELRPAEAVLFATPEYNRSVPGVLKNAIDVGSRPPAESVWRYKPAAVVSVTNGHGRVRRQSPSEAVAGVYGHADIGAAGIVYWARRFAA